jgi:uncharacterized protein YpmB
MNQKMLDELVTILVTRDVAQKLKVKAILQGLTRQDYLKKIANEKNKKV